MSPFGRVALQQTIHSGLPRIQTEILAEKPLKGKTIPLIGDRQEDILQKLVGTSSKKGLPHGAGIGHRQRGHVDDAPHGGAGRQDVDRFGCTQ